MNKSILIITDEWIDIINLDEVNNIAIRLTNKDDGTYLIEDNILKINWYNWEAESFKNINNIFYKIKNNDFEIFIENNSWNEICIFNIYNNEVKKKFKNNDCGKYYFLIKDNKIILYIEWDFIGLELYNSLDHGKIFSNTIFGKKINNNKLKEIKIIAIVFPQFHEIPENNEFWGKGFTEWTLLKNIPRIVNNEIIKQPHDDIGYFDLTNFEHRKYMRILSDKFNIYGFCFYHYWFKNKKVMYKPLELMLKDNEPNKPFFFCWANEQWTKKWDGGNNEILMAQDYGNEKDNIDHFYYLLNFFNHTNYIKKNNKPIFIFYRIEENEIESINNIISLWNDLAIKNGFDGIYFMRFLGPFNNNININNINGYIDFQPGYSTSNHFMDIASNDDNFIFDINNYNEELYLNKNADIKELVEKNVIMNGYEHFKQLNDKEKKFRISKFNVFDGIKLYENILNENKIYNDEHRGISLNWNNTPRRNHTNDDYSKYPNYYKDIDPNIFENYFYKLLEKINNSKNKDLDFLFISAWNEWNEQAVLEPNNEDGYDYLNKIKNMYLKFYNYPKSKNILNICHKGGGTEKYMNDLKNYFIEYNFINFDFFNINVDYSNLYNDIDIVHINSILFNNLKNSYFYFINTYFKNSIKIITIHDYQWLFPDDPNIHMEKFLNETIPNLNHNNFSQFNNLLSISSIIIFPSKNILDNYKYFIDLNKYNNKIVVVNHMDKLINYNFLVIPKIDIDINISFIGYFVNYKGSEIFKNISNKYNTYKNYNLKYHIYGNIDSKENTDSNFIYHNEYNDNQIIDTLHLNNIHGIVHLSVFEESYCYALTNSINSGIPIFYLDRGVFSDRLPINNKYFPTNLNNVYNNFTKFIDYLIENNNINNFYKLNNSIQPNKWYLENY
jgi:hypothetical protein